MKESLFQHLYCTKCGKVYDPHQVQQLCSCGYPLAAKYDLEKGKRLFHKDSLKERYPSLWRYFEILPVFDEQNIVTLGEGFTPIHSAPRSGRDHGIPNLYIKDEGILPSGTFKSRGAAVGVSKAKELGVKTLAMPTNGNAGAAWSLYSARAGIKSVIVMPESGPMISRNESFEAGSDLYLVKGLISDAGKIIARSVEKNGWYDVATLKEPYRIEGKKTMGLEIAEQFDWNVPDVILYPTGGGAGIIGIYKGLRELQELGFIGEKMPKLVAVQAEGCAPIVEAFQAHQSESTFFPDSHTVAFGINVPKPMGDYLILDALQKTEGTAIAVDDASILDGQKELATKDGIFICPEGATAYVGAKRLRESGFIKESDRVVVLNTGAGLKYPHTVPFEPRYVDLDATL